MILPTDGIFTCPECGSLYIQFMAWVDAQSSTFAGDLDDDGPEGDDPKGYCDGCSRNVEPRFLSLDELIERARAEMEDATRELAQSTTDPLVQILLSIEVERAMEEVPDVGEISCRLNTVGSKITTLVHAMQALDGEAPKVRSRLMRRFLQLNNLRERLAMKQRRSS